MPVNAHPDTTFSSHVHNDWTQVQTGGPSGGSGSTGSNIDLTADDKFPQNHFPVLEMPGADKVAAEKEGADKKAVAKSEEKEEPKSADE